MTADSVDATAIPVVGVRPIEEAFEAMFLRTRDTVLRYARAHTPDDDEAVDVVASTFERAWVALQGPGLPDPPLPWLLRVARNTAIDRHRRRLGHRRALEVLRLRPQRTAPPPESEAIAHDSDREFRQLLANLPEGQRDALALRYGADLTIRDVAAQLGRSEAAAQQLISRGLARLREIHHDVD